MSNARSRLPAFARGLCDDAAVFPPGLMSLTDAVPAHARHQAAPYGELVGSFVLGATAIAGLGPLLGSGRLGVSVTAPAGPAQVAGAIAGVSALPVEPGRRDSSRGGRVELRGLEVAVPAGVSALEFFAELDRARTDAEEVPVFVEIPRDERAAEMIAACAAHGHRAKFRAGGVRADLYPDVDELAGRVVSAVEARVPFKATAGLHHAVRNTDPSTGFDQHGFLNLLLATDAALRGARSEVAAVLAERDATSVATRVAELDAGRAEAARSMFLSFGTCDIVDPLTELVDLGLVSAAVLTAGGVIATADSPTDTEGVTP